MMHCFRNTKPVAYSVVALCSFFIAMALPAFGASKKKATAKCNTCKKQSVTTKKRGRQTRSAAVPCQPKGYVDPRLSKNLNAALRDLRRVGVRPTITSAWRSSQQQAQFHRCSKSRRCRHARGLYGALPAGSSVHEAGFAIDIAGIATGPRGARRLTSRGRTIVQAMKKHGFAWRYGLADPAHFEADPQRYGYRNLQQAIRTNQTRCQVKLVAAAKSRPQQRGRRR